MSCYCEKRSFCSALFEQIFHSFEPAMKVLFTHAYFLQDDQREQAIMKPYPPLGLLYLAAWLERHGVSNEVFDTTFSSRQALQQNLCDQRPEIVAIYTNLMTKLSVIELVGFIRSVTELKDTLVVLGGPDVTHNAPEYLSIGADLVVIGEGEQTMLEIALSANGRNVEEMAHIPGIAFQTTDGLLFKTAPREKIRDIDLLPFPAREKINLQNYLDAWKKAHGHSAVSISTQRGCPYTCRWCSTAVYGQSYRRRSPGNVVDEIASLQQAYHFDLVWFVDDVFTVSHKWLQSFHDELQRRNIQVRFECITRADRLTEEVLQLLRACGCFRVWIGAESGSQRIIDAMDRRVEVGQVRAMIRAARNAGIEAGQRIKNGGHGVGIAGFVQHTGQQRRHKPVHGI